MGKTLVKIIAPLLVLGLLFYIVDAAAIIARLTSADPRWLAVSVAALTALTFLMARRWQLTAQALDLDLPYGRAVREYYLAQLLNVILPGGVAGDAARAVRLRKEGDLLRATQSVLLERLMGQITLFGVMFAGFVVAMTLPAGLPWPVWTWGVLGLGLIIACGGVIYARSHGAIAQFLTRALGLMREPQQIILSGTIALLIVFSFYACAVATGTLLPHSALFTLIPLVLTAMLIPLSIAGWGWREGAAAALFPFAAATPDAGVAAGIAYGAMMLVAALPAAFILFFTTARPTSSAKAIPDA